MPNCCRDAEIKMLGMREQISKWVRNSQAAEAERDRYKALYGAARLYLHDMMHMDYETAEKLIDAEIQKRLEGK